MNKRITRKYKKGGDIHENLFLEKILSIGYEIETGDLAKLTLREDINPETGEEELILFNTDSTTEVIKKLNEQLSEEDEEDEDLLYRQMEFINDVIYTKNGKKDKNSTFVITNDIHTDKFRKILREKCLDIKQPYVDSGLIDENHELDDNDILFLKGEDGTEYKINFVYNSNDELYCKVFTDVEWVITYYKPKVSKNIILETFLNVVDNLNRHLKNIKSEKSNLYINKYDYDEDTETFKKTNEKMVKFPENKTLFQKEGTNMYYLQMNYSEKSLEIDDIRLVPQMTFSCKSEDIYEVMVGLMTDTIDSMEGMKESNDLRLNDIVNAMNCVNKLFEDYNRMQTEFKLIETSSNAKIIKIIKNYCMLIIYKLYIYFDDYLPLKEEDRKYFKVYQPLNLRHTNYDLYLELKKYIAILFPSISEKESISIIHNLIINQNILMEYIGKTQTSLRKGVFNISNILDKNHKKYGDPTYSLISYFNFFENPAEKDNINEEEGGTFYDYDWLAYKEIDSFSTKMKIKEGVILIEFRAFMRFMNEYMYFVGDSSLKTDIQQCVNKKIPITLGILKRFSDIYSNKNSTSTSVKKSKAKTAKSKK